VKSVDTPEISIVMPVFNSGEYLLEAVQSVLGQVSLPDCTLPSFELIVVDDHSTDPHTQDMLGKVAALDARIQLFSNLRKKGAAGARNTGIVKARGNWIAFLDSDDILFPTSLALRWRVVQNQQEVKWVGANFRLLRPLAEDANSVRFESAQSLIAKLDDANLNTDITCLRKPVREFGDKCMTGIMTVLIKRSLVVENGMFNELLPRAEDYHLWFKCAFQEDLWLLNADVAYYRIHPASLTHGNKPRYLHEDTMVEFLLNDSQGQRHKDVLIKRFDFVMQDQCYFYRGQKAYGAAMATALQWLVKRPLRLSAWKEVVASGLRVT
jgi:glycosyltransferase involved in cell wall biosynthesis